MTKAEFQAPFKMLMDAFGVQDEEKALFYFRMLGHLTVSKFDSAVRRIVETRDDRYGFPLVAEINTAVDQVALDDHEATPDDFERREYCQRCENVGFYMGDDYQAKLCSCRAGRLKEVRFRLPLTARRTQVEEEMRRLPPAEPPFRGLKEKHPAGFWTLTLEEHEKHMERKRQELETIVFREIEVRPDRRPSKMIERELLRKQISEVAFKKTLAEIVKPKPNQDDDLDIPF